MTEGPDHEPAFLIALGSAEVIDTTIDSDEYKHKRWEESIPKETVLKKVVHIHRYLTEHAGEGMTQAQIGEPFGYSQGMVSETMDKFPSFFKRVNGTWITLLDIPIEWMHAYDRAMLGKPVEVTYTMEESRPIDREMRKDIKKILSIVSLMNEPVETKRNASGGYNTSRPYLDDAVIDLVYQRPSVRRLDIYYKEYDTEEKMGLLYRLMYALDKEIPEVMKVVSEVINKAK